MHLRDERARADPAAALTPAASDAALWQRLADGATDTVAGMLRCMGRHGFSIDQQSDEEFIEACEVWARHVAIGAPVAPGATEPAHRGERAWADVAAFFRDRRRNEQSFVNGRLSAFKGIIWELVDGLRVLSQSGISAEAAIHDSLFQLERAVETGSFDNVRAALGRAVGDINSALRKRRADLDGQLTRMSSRLETLRADLLSARRAMELDPLTRLYNRGAFDGALQRYLDLAALSGQPLVLMMIDLDHFKRINDEHGHPCGDQVLVATAACLTRTFLRKNDFVARYGGEEFAALLPDTTGEHATPLAQRLRARVGALEVKDAAGQALAVTCSIGFTSFRPEDTPQSLLARADAALYRAKADGRDRVEVG